MERYTDDGRYKRSKEDGLGPNRSRIPINVTRHADCSRNSGDVDVKPLIIQRGSVTTCQANSESSNIRSFKSRPDDLERT